MTRRVPSFSPFTDGDAALTCAFVVIGGFVLALIAFAMVHDRTAQQPFFAWCAARGLARVDATIIGGVTFRGTLSGRLVTVYAGDVPSSNSSTADSRTSIIVVSPKHPRAVLLGRGASFDEQEQGEDLPSLDLAGADGLVLRASEPPRWLDVAMRRRRWVPSLVVAGTWGDRIEVRLEGRWHDAAALDAALDLALAMAGACDGA
jgi:hypothetical protein